MNISRWARSTPRRYRALVAGASVVLLTACGGKAETKTETVEEPPPEVSWPQVGCDPLVPSFCGFPFPSNVHTVDDASTATGRRVALPAEVMPVAADGTLSSPEPFNVSDGFPASTALLAELPGATSEGLVTPDRMGDSLLADSKTVIIDAETGKRVLHFAELDQSLDGIESPSFMLRPMERLRDGRRYIVAIRDVVHRDGELVQPSPAFKALRDKLPFSDDASVDARRALYADIFTRLDDAGVSRGSLQLAWDFTTASLENNTGWLTHMRDDALQWMAREGATYTIDKVTEEAEGDPLLVRIDGHFTAPLYLDSTDPGGRLVFDENGKPIAQGEHQVPFGLIIPKSAARTPAALMQYGHGLLGSYDQINAGNFKDLAEQHHYAIFGTTLTGMGDGDSGYIAAVLDEGKIEKLASMFDRLHQGMTDQLLAMRMMRDGFSKDETYGAYLDPSERYYHGISQGGIFGGTYMALSTDVERGVLGVMGMPYNLLLGRSVDFTPFFILLQTTHSDPRAQRLLLGMIQMLWDRTEPSGYVPYLREGTPLGAPPHEVLMRSALGDHQVTTLGAQVMARAVGAKHLTSGLRDLVELEAATEVEKGSAYIEYDFGLPEDPLCNRPQKACDDPHGALRNIPAAITQLDTFLRTGTATNFCEDGLCSFPEKSGCKDEEDAAVCPGP